MDILDKVLVRLINTPLVVHQPTLCTFWIHLGDLESLPTDEHIWTSVITCGGVRRGRGVRGWWGLSTLPFVECPSGGASSELEELEAGDSPAFGSKEGVAILS